MSSDPIWESWNSEYLDDYVERVKLAARRLGEELVEAANHLNTAMQEFVRKAAQ